MTASLCIVVKGFPRISETFITRELEALQDAGLAFSLASLRRPSSDTNRVQHKVSRSPNYLPEYLHDEPLRVWRSFVCARAQPGFPAAWCLFRADLARDLSRNRVRRFGQACVLAAELPVETRHLHAHFIHTPASVARYAAAIRGLTFSVSAHAKDIWTTPDWDLSHKLAQAEFVCVCNASGAHRLEQLASSKKPNLWPHLIHKMAPRGPRPRRDSNHIRFLTVARAVSKKGLELLLEALSRLPPHPPWSWTHIGGGSLLDRLKEIGQSHPFKDRLTFLGPQPHQVVVDALQSHDVFILSAVVSGDGDRDGRPNALIEAMSAGLACVATPSGGIPEILNDGAGLLAEPKSERIADVLTSLLKDPAAIEKLAIAAQRRAKELLAEGESAFHALERALRQASHQ